MVTNAFYLSFRRLVQHKNNPFFLWYYESIVLTLFAKSTPIQ